MSRLLNQATMKRYLLDRAQMLRPALGMKRVSDEALQNLESRLHNMADDMIRRLLEPEGARFVTGHDFTREPLLFDHEQK